MASWDAEGPTIWEGGQTVQGLLGRDEARPGRSSRPVWTFEPVFPQAGCLVRTGTRNVLCDLERGQVGCGSWLDPASAESQARSQLRPQQSAAPQMCAGGEDTAQ